MNINQSPRTILLNGLLAICLFSPFAGFTPDHHGPATFESDCFGLEGGVVVAHSPQVFPAFGPEKSGKISFQVEGALGSRSSWVATDLQGRIQKIQADGNFDFTNFGFGISAVFCVHWPSDELAGLRVGKSIKELEGCYRFSRGLLVIRVFTPTTFDREQIVAQETVVRQHIPSLFTGFTVEELEQFQPMQLDFDQTVLAWEQELAMHQWGKQCPYEGGLGH